MTCAEKRSNSLHFNETRKQFLSGCIRVISIVIFHNQAASSSAFFGLRKPDPSMLAITCE